MNNDGYVGGLFHFYLSVHVPCNIFNELVTAIGLVRLSKQRMSMLA